MNPEQVLRGVLPPLVVAFVLLLPRLRRSTDGARADLSWLGSLGLGLGAAVGATWLLGGPEKVLNPTSVQLKLCWVALLAGVLGAADRLLGTRSAGRIATRTVLRFVGPAAVFWWLLAFRRRGAWSDAEAWVYISAFAGAVAVLGTGIDLVASRRPGASYPLAVCAAVSVAAGALVAGGSASYGQITGATAAALGAPVAVGLFNPGLIARGAGLPVALMLGAALLAGHYTAELAETTAIACFAAPLLPVLVEILPLRERPALAGTLRVLLAVAPGLVWTYLTYEAPPENPYY